MKSQIPIYRALKLGTENEYVEGYLTYELRYAYDQYFIQDNTIGEILEIDPSTLAISFDGGNSWYSDFESIADICREYLPKIKQKA